MKRLIFIIFIFLGLNSQAQYFFFGQNQEKEPDETTTIIQQPSLTFSVSEVIHTGGLLVIDWGDGSRSAFAGSATNETHNYSSQEVRIIKLLCFGGNITDIDVHTNLISSIDVSENIEMVNFACYENILTSLDVLSNINIQDLACQDNQLTSINLSNNTLMAELGAGVNQFTSLDLSNNTLLTGVFLRFNNFTSLAVDDIICDIDSHGLSNGSLNTSDSSAPTATGIICKNNLTGKGWSVTTD